MAVQKHSSTIQRRAVKQELRPDDEKNLPLVKLAGRKRTPQPKVEEIMPEIEQLIGLSESKKNTEAELDRLKELLTLRQRKQRVIPQGGMI